MTELEGLLLCPANVSEGRDVRLVEALAASCGAALLDVHRDPDHHRSVLTLGGPPETVETAARRLAEAVAERVDLRRHEGVHPRLGALDVVPFVALDPAEEERAVAAARRYAGWLGASLEVPVFLYDGADPSRRSLPAARREAFEGRPPDRGPPRPHPALGATAVGTRRPLVAVNCRLDTADPALARELAGGIRERGGGLPGVRALGFGLATRGASQVSMNLVDLGRTGLETACSAVREAAERAGASVTEVELVGLVPAAELARCSPGFLAWAGLGEERTVEAALRRSGWLP